MQFLSIVNSFVRNISLLTYLITYDALFSQASFVKTNAPHKLCRKGKSKASEAGKYSWDKSFTMFLCLKSSQNFCVA